MTFAGTSRSALFVFLILLVSPRGVSAQEHQVDGDLLREALPRLWPEHWFNAEAVTKNDVPWDSLSLAGFEYFGMPMRVSVALEIDTAGRVVSARPVNAPQLPTDIAAVSLAVAEDWGSRQTFEGTEIGRGAVVVTVPLSRVFLEPRETRCPPPGLFRALLSEWSSTGPSLLIVDPATGEPTHPFPWPAEVDMRGSCRDEFARWIAGGESSRSQVFGKWEYFFVEGARHELSRVRLIANGDLWVLEGVSASGAGALVDLVSRSGRLQGAGQAEASFLMNVEAVA